MKKIFISVIITVITVISVQAQIKVKSTGRVIVGTERTTDDALNVLSMQIMGNGTGGYYPGSKLAFGDFGQYNYYGWNVFIGEYGNTDCDKLWLHGKNGIYLTWNRGDNIIGYFDVNQTDRFTFNCDVYSNGIKLTSDSRLKTNVNKINNSMKNLRKLNGVSYNLLQKNTSTNAIVQKPIVISDTTKISDKEKKDKAFFEAMTAKMNANKPKRMGFIAQDLQKVFPDLVDKDSAGYLTVDYIGLIPVIVEALKDQDSIISYQSSQIDSLKKLVAKKNTSTTKSAEIPATVQSANITTGIESTGTIKPASLAQNAPNPFSQSTNIGYYLPESVQNANLYIYDMNGVQIKSYPIFSKGDGSITINGNELKAGMYLYTLITNGQEVATKRMILTQ
jgi:hypothetical protein